MTKIFCVGQCIQLMYIYYQDRINCIQTVNDEEKNRNMETVFHFFCANVKRLYDEVVPIFVTYIPR